MSLSRFVFAAPAVCVALLAQSTPDVGSGAPTPLIQQLFQLAYYRNGFAYTVSFPPLADVRRLGTNGLVQEFQDSAKTSGVRLALIMPNTSAPVVEGVTAVFQMQASMYAYFNSIGVNTAGMPTTDTLNCPSLNTANACTYQLFDKPYALFVFKEQVNNSANTFYTRAPFYAKWAAAGGISGMGPAVSAETAVTSSVSSAAATAQYFDRGAIYNVTSGTNSGRIFTVVGPIYDLFASNNVEKGFLGFPITDELSLPNGMRRQTFEGGSIDYDPTKPNVPAVLRYPVSGIVVSSAGSTIRLKLGETADLQANVFGPNGIALTDRQVLWTTSNGRVVTVSNSNPATVKAVGGGTAVISATSEGKTSAGITFVVSAPCCQVGEGAPTASVGQAFQDAAARNRLNLKLPAANAVVRVGAGYVQQLEGVDGTAYMVAVPDRVQTGFLISGRILVRYLELGGPAGSLGYPMADATSGGRQNFETAALAGDPVRTVSGEILAKWGALSYERGVAGSPTGVAVDSLTFRATEVRVQSFQNAQLISLTRTAKTYAVTGLILARFALLGGVTGRLGAPSDDEYGLNGRRRQDFEGGYVEYAQGDTQARETESARHPVVIATPTAVIAGSRVKLAIGGFNENANVRVSITGQPDFVVNTANGAHVWEAFIPASTRSGSFSVRAVDVANAANSAQTSYTVRTLSEARLTISVVRGDAQTGVPGGVLPLPLTAVVRDENGAAVTGAPVKFTASPGAAVESATATTDARGEAYAILRLPSAEGITLVTVEAGRQVITMSARAARASLSNFPKFTQAVSGLLGDGPETIAKNGAMLTGAAAMLRYLQSRGQAPSPNGLADVAALNSFLQAACGVDSGGAQSCDGYLRVGAKSEPAVNLWRAAGFVNNSVNVLVAKPDLTAIRDLIGDGLPALVALEMTASGRPAGGHFVVATGVEADGSISIMDPDPASGRTNLSEYLGGFSAGGNVMSATIAGVAAFEPGQLHPGFVVAADARIEIASATGACGASFEFALSSKRAQMRHCEGGGALYELDLNGDSFRGSLSTLGTPASRFELIGGGSAAFKVARADGQWTTAPMDLAITPGGVVNAASFTSAIAPGALATVFGAGFGSSTQAITAEVNGVAATVVSVAPFQLNVQIPPQTAPGQATLRVRSSAGSAEEPVTIVATAPALFTTGGSQAAAVNRNGTVNSQTNPASRGEVLVLYGTGFGEVVAQGSVMRTATPVTATVGGAPAQVLFAGIAPGYPGVYQLNLQLPAGMPPGLTIPISVQQGDSSSNTVQVAVQ